jgi:hypothetical protein
VQLLATRRHPSDFPNDDFFPNVDELFSNLNMVDNTNIVVVAANVAAANAGTYVFLSFIFQILIEFLVLLFEVDAIGFSCLDAIGSSNLLVITISFITVYIIILY